MADNEEFNKTVILAATEMEQHFNIKKLPATQDNYRLHLTCVRNLFDSLTRASLIKPDPYKGDKKITKIICPETSQFNENERPIVLGERLSNYESMLDFVCNYMRFAVDQLNMEKIKKLNELNKTFDWKALTPNSLKSNTKALGFCMSQLKKTSPGIALGLLKDCVTKSANAIAEIDATLKELAQFQRERYKIEVRKAVVENEKFNKASMTDATAFQNEIKRLFSSCMGKRPFVQELIQEIILEETAPNKAELQKALLAKLKTQNERSEKKEPTVDTHEILVEAIRVLASTCEQYSVIYEKITNNASLLQSEHNSFKDKIKKLFRQLFNLKEPIVEYTLTIVDKRTNAKRTERINFNAFTANFVKRIRLYANCASTAQGGYQKLKTQGDKDLLDFLTKQLSENSLLFSNLTALDEYFKSNVSPANKSKVKGISMELMTIKNLIVKSTRERSEYLGYVEEQEQMKHLENLEPKN